MLSLYLELAIKEQPLVLQSVSTDVTDRPDEISSERRKKRVPGLATSLSALEELWVSSSRPTADSRRRSIASKGVLETSDEVSVVSILHQSKSQKSSI
jgi:hypothetical protein